MSHRPILLVAGLAMVAAGCSSGGGGSAGPDTIAPEDTVERPAEVIPEFAEVDCPMPEFETDLTIECGQVDVPQDRSATGGRRRVQLAVAVLRSRSDDPRPDPLVYLEGGPGGAALLSAEFWADTPLVEDRDLILVDQRGTGFSKPSLNCHELDGEFAFVRDLDACRNRLRSSGVDIPAFTSTESAADLADLRRAMGYGEWNLLGISYGTRLALTAMRDQADGLRAVVLDSTYPPHVDSYEEFADNGQRAFDALFAACAADAGCMARNGDIGAKFAALVEGSRPWLAGVTFSALYDPDAIPILPAAINALHAGDLGRAIDILFPEPTDEDALDDEILSLFGSEGVFYSIQCNEEIPFNNRLRVFDDAEDSEVGFALTGSVESLFQVCRRWGGERAPDSVREPVVSDVPTLVLAGGLDPITPPSMGERAAEHLGAATYALFPPAGHAVLAHVPCSFAMVDAFLDDPAADVDTSCADTAPPPAFR